MQRIRWQLIPLPQADQQLYRAPAGDVAAPVVCERLRYHARLLFACLASNRCVVPLYDLVEQRDERRFVWRAAASALWKLGRKRPDIIRPELARWLEDERRVNVAREAIKHL